MLAPAAPSSALGSAPLPVCGPCRPASVEASFGSVAASPGEDCGAGSCLAAERGAGAIARLSCKLAGFHKEVGEPFDLSDASSDKASFGPLLGRLFGSRAGSGGFDSLSESSSSTFAGIDLRGVTFEASATGPRLPGTPHQPHPLFAMADPTLLTLPPGPLGLARASPASSAGSSAPTGIATPTGSHDAAARAQGKDLWPAAESGPAAHDPGAAAAAAAPCGTAGASSAAVVGADDALRAHVSKAVALDGSTASTAPARQRASEEASAIAAARVAGAVEPSAARAEAAERAAVDEGGAAAAAAVPAGDAREVRKGAEEMAAPPGAPAGAPARRTSTPAQQPSAAVTVVPRARSGSAPGAARRTDTFSSEGGIEAMEAMLRVHDPSPGTSPLASAGGSAGGTPEASPKGGRARARIAAVGVAEVAEEVDGAGGAGRADAVEARAAVKPAAVPAVAPAAAEPAASPAAKVKAAAKASPLPPLKARHLIPAAFLTLAAQLEAEAAAKSRPVDLSSPPPPPAPRTDGAVAGASPLVVFVNGLSGGRAGPKILSALSSALGPAQVVDLSSRRPDRALGGLYAALRAYESIGDPEASAVRHRLRILAAGGDGTVTWILKTLLDLDPTPAPPVAVLPLGTGNDLSQTLGWGETFRDKWVAGAGLKDTLDRIDGAKGGRMDAWGIRIQWPGEGANGGGAANGAGAARAARPRLDPLPGLPPALTHAPSSPLATGTFWNYFSIGLDARATHSFHALRHSAPLAASSRLVNKLWYSFFSCSSGWFCGAPALAPKLRLRGRRGDAAGGADDAGAGWSEIPVPEETRALLVLNLQSYGGGRDIWGAKDTKGMLGAGRQGDAKAAPEDRASKGVPSGSPLGPFTTPSTSDGLLEVVAFGNGWHAMLSMGEVSKTLHAIRVAQVSALEVSLEAPEGASRASKKTYAQIDGEPWVQKLPGPEDGGPLVISLSSAGSSAVLKAGGKPRGGDRAKRVARRAQEAA